MDSLLHGIQEVLQDIQDTKDNLAVLEQVFTSFEKIQASLLKEQSQMRLDLDRETHTNSELRTINTEIALVGAHAVKAWLRALNDHGLQASEEDRAILFRAYALGWAVASELPR